MNLNTNRKRKEKKYNKTDRLLPSASPRAYPTVQNGTIQFVHC